MSELDLQRLWQDQPLDPAPVEPERASRAALLDFAQPTSRFAPAPARVRPFVALALAFTAVALVAVIALRPSARPSAPPPPVPRGESFEDLLAGCRTFASWEAPTRDWDRADQACQRVLEEEPLHPEALALLRRVGVLRACEANLERANALASAERVEEALASYEKLTPDCEGFFVRALAPARAAAEVVRQRAGLDCRQYAGAKQWGLALPRCELWARVGCQSLTPSVLTGLPEYKALIDARGRLQAGAPPWRCAELAVLRGPAAAPDPTAQLSFDLSKRFAAPELRAAVAAYFRGDLASAPVPVQKVLESPRQAEHHQVARALLLDLNEAIGLYQRGTADLLAGRLEKTAEVFRRALELDERLMLGAAAGGMSGEEKKKELQKRSSFVRRSITEGMAARSYEQGRSLADRKDFRGACRSWKLGLSFSRANIDLLKAVTNVCTHRAAAAFEEAQTCEQLRAALDYAVEGDGFAEKIGSVLESEGCAPAQ